MVRNSHSLVNLVACSDLDASFDKTDHVLVLEERTIDFITFLFNITASSAVSTATRSSPALLILVQF